MALVISLVSAGLLGGCGIVRHKALSIGLYIYATTGLCLAVLRKDAENRPTFTRLLLEQSCLLCVMDKYQDQQENEMVLDSLQKFDLNDDGTIDSHELGWTLSSMGSKTWWELVASLLGRLAIHRYDVLVDIGLETALLADGGKLALQTARDLSYAAQVCESFFQILIFDRARETGRAAMEVHPEEVRPAYSDVLGIYHLLDRALDTLAYTSVGINSRMPDLRHRKLSKGPTVVLVFAVVGAWAEVGAVTLWSILRHRSVPLRIFVLGDMLGIRDFRRVVRAIGEAVPPLLTGVRFDYIDVFLHPRMLAYRRRLPAGCAGSNMSVALFGRLVCHLLLPADVERAIAMDLGDVLVFEDILELWKEGDRLAEDEVFAAASHRAHEEAWRHAKPSMLNGGVVLYEVSRMRRSNYTEDTIWAAELGIERGYAHYCAWDQDIINVLHTDVWESKRVRVLPCEWSLFPVTSWQFFWNTPDRWLPELFERRRYPGLLAAGHLEHFCPDELQLLPAIFAFPNLDQHRNMARDYAIVAGERNRRPGSSMRGADGTMCKCGGRAALLHVPSTMKLWPWSHRLFEHHQVPFFMGAAPGSNIKDRKEQTPVGKGGGFWGSETGRDLAAMEDKAIEWAKMHGGVVAAGNCKTLPSTNGQYARVDFLSWERGESLLISAETTATEDAYIFVGSTKARDFENSGFEFGVGIEDNTKSVIRWGVQGVELASLVGPALNSSQGGRAAWSKFWVALDSVGRASVGLGDSVGDTSSQILGAKIIGDELQPPSPEQAEVFVGTLALKQEGWVVCHH